MFRNLRNDSMYRQGRGMLQSDGKEANPRDRRMVRAVDQKTAYGAQLQHTSWLMYEYTTMRDLHQLGAAVPEPIVASENAILMTYIGDENMAAPTLNAVRLEQDEAEFLFKEVLRNIELMLSQHIVHGDLSAYNILYWEGQITLIDFPQVIDVRTNDNGYMILHRDVTRICEYFAKQGVDCDAQALTDDLWARYIGLDERGREADASRFEAEDEAD
jgi:RIO kinase 1